MKVKIDDQIVEAQDGELLLQVALRNGIEIPHFCYHPCLSAAGNCRICLVKVEGMPKLLPSCNLAVTPDMQVFTDNPEIRVARKAVLQFIMLNHPVDCGICDKAGECRLQNYQQQYGDIEPLSIEAQREQSKFYELSKRILLDNERCILCNRCVRFTQEISKSNQLGIVERGSESLVRRLDGQTFDDPYSDNVVGLCPVGALLSKGFLYQSRVWYLEPVDSVCTGCARCCSIKVWRRKKEWRFNGLNAELNHKVYRITAGENAEINDRWLCNEGFDLHKQVGRKRILTPLLRGRQATMEEVLGEAHKSFARAKSPAVVVSAQASNEQLQAFKQLLANKVTVYTSAVHWPVADELPEDDFLICGDKAPNSYGVQKLLGKRDCNPAVSHDLVLVWGDNIILNLFNGAKLIQLGTHASERDTPPDVFIPLSTSFERSGSFSNCDGISNSFEQVFDKPDTVLHAEEVFRRLA